MGPAPKPAQQRRRRNRDTVETTRLPAAGRSGDAPDWPLSAEALEEELEVWDELWRLPQAISWERTRIERTVARYVRVLVRCESLEASAALLSEARQLEDRLGLSSLSLLRLRWTVVDEDADDSGEDTKDAPPVRRLRVVDPALVRDSAPS